MPLPGGCPQLAVASGPCWKPAAGPAPSHPWRRSLDAGQRWGLGKERLSCRPHVKSPQKPSKAFSFICLLPKRKSLFENCFLRSNMETCRNLGKRQLSVKKGKSPIGLPAGGCRRWWFLWCVSRRQLTHRKPLANACADCHLCQPVCGWPSACPAQERGGTGETEVQETRLTGQAAALLSAPGQVGRRPPRSR